MGWTKGTPHKRAENFRGFSYFLFSTFFLTTNKLLSRHTRGSGISQTLCKVGTKTRAYRRLRFIRCTHVSQRGLFQIWLIQCSRLFSKLSHSYSHICVQYPLELPRYSLSLDFTSRIYQLHWILPEARWQCFPSGLTRSFLLNMNASHCATLFFYSNLFQNYTNKKKWDSHHLDECNYYTSAK